MRKTLTISAAVLVALALGFAGYVYMINRPLPQNEHDVAILDRAIVLLSEENDWARTGDRSCPQSGPPFNLYCAMREASIQVTGEFKHRSAALQQVRYAIERQRPGVEYAHRLWDYNNDPATSFEDLHGVLQDARAALAAAWQSKGG